MWGSPPHEGLPTVYNSRMVSAHHLVCNTPCASSLQPAAHHLCHSPRLGVVIVEILTIVYTLSRKIRIVDP